MVPKEILVMNDGSSDDTAAVLESYGDRIKLFSQRNGGLAKARNELLIRATGDFVAFLDSDDLWHSRYLEVQWKLFSEHPEAVAFWTNHINFSDGESPWSSDPLNVDGKTQLMSALDFFKRYNKATGPFSCFSYCCVPRQILTELGNEPFKEMGAEDSYCCSLLALLGRPVVYSSQNLVAYRVRKDSLSHDHSWTFGVWVHVFELLEERYKNAANDELLRAFQLAFASKRRGYAKLLMGSGRPLDAKKQLQKSVGDCRNLVSVAKSLALLSSTYMPSMLQPKWPSKYRG